MSDMDSSIPAVRGLVLTGGKSSRMGKDKALMEFHGKPQALHTFELLSRHIEKVYISSRKGQRESGILSHLPQIFDLPGSSGSSLGPSAGILAAMDFDQSAAWLVIACDLPYTNDCVIERLLKERDPKQTATCFRSSSDGLPEPLCTIWEPRGRLALLESLKRGHACPRKVLINAPILELIQKDPKSLDNINNPEEAGQVVIKD